MPVAYEKRMPPKHDKKKEHDQELQTKNWFRANVHLPIKHWNAADPTLAENGKGQPQMFHMVNGVDGKDRGATEDRHF